MTLADGEPASMMFDFLDQEICGFDVQKNLLVCELNRCGFPATMLTWKVEANSVVLEGHYSTMSKRDYIHFQRTIVLPDEADSSAVNFDVSDPMFLRFSCPISRRGDLNDYMKAEVAGEKEPKIYNFSTGRSYSESDLYSTDTCGFPAANIDLDVNNSGFVLKGSWNPFVGDFVCFSKSVKVDDRSNYSDFVKEYDESLLTVTGLQN